MPTYWPDKNPTDVLDFTADFTDFLETAEDITSKTVTPESGIAVDSSSISSDSKKIIVWLSGGTAGKEYDVDIEVGSNAAPDARTIKRKLRIAVRADV